MKRKILTLLTALVFAFSVFGAVACDSAGGLPTNPQTPPQAEQSTKPETPTPPAHTHEYGDWVKDTNADTHTKTCTCGDKVTQNCSGGTATCITRAVCEDCNAEYGQVNANNHTREEFTYTSLGESGHSKKYACCGTIVVAIEAHTFTDNQCDYCNFVKPSEGLSFTLLTDTDTYAVSGIGTCTDADIVIPSTYNNKPVTYIAEYAFYHCGRCLTSIEIPDSVTSIGRRAFEDCSNLTSVTFGENSQLTSIGDNAFCYCRSLTSIEIPDSVTSIGGGAFSLCSSLTSVTFGEDSQLTSIGDIAFYDCDSLTSITIPDSVTSIEVWAFTECDNLTIYCEVKEESKPSGWSSGWNASNCPVIWDYKNK